MKQFSLLAAFTDGFRLFKSNWFVFLGLGVVMSVILGLLAALGDGYIFADTLLETRIVDGELIDVLSLLGWVVFIPLVLTLIVWDVLGSKIALNRIDHKKWTDTLFLSWRQWGKLFVSTVLFVLAAFVLVIILGVALALLGETNSAIGSLVALVIAVFGIISFLYFSARFFFYALFILDKDTGVIDSFRMSARIAKPALVRVAIFIISVLVATEVPSFLVSNQDIASYGIGLGIVCVAWLFILPLMTIVGTVMYRALSTQGE